MNRQQFKTSWIFPLSIYFMRTFPLLSQWIRHKMENNRRWTVRKEILNYYKNNPQDIKDAYIYEGVKYIKSKGLQLFPYYWADRYNPLKIKVYYDADSGLKYVLHQAKKLYYKRNLPTSEIQLSYNNLLIEQDERSPHTYLTNKFDLDEETLLLDLGAAEGIFALTVIERVRKVYIFESDPEWIEPLMKTFEPWNEKIKIINKYVSHSDSENSVTLDSILKGEIQKSLFFKIDVEGAEKDVILGGIDTFKFSDFKIKAAICTYHYHHDYEELSNLMKNELKYKVTPSDSYMLCFYSKPLSYPFFRKVLLYCEN